MKRAQVTLRLTCDVCGLVSTLEPLPDAEPVPLDNVWYAEIESQALDAYAHASATLGTCSQCELAAFIASQDRQ